MREKLLMEQKLAQEMGDFKSELSKIQQEQRLQRRILMLSVPADFKIVLDESGSPQLVKLAKDAPLDEEADGAGVLRPIETGERRLTPRDLTTEQRESVYPPRQWRASRAPRFHHRPPPPYRERQERQEPRERQETREDQVPPAYRAHAATRSRNLGGQVRVGRGHGATRTRMVRFEGLGQQDSSDEYQYDLN